MNDLQSIQENLAWLIPLLIIISIWSSVWKIIAMWKSARNNHLVYSYCNSKISWYFANNLYFIK